MHVAEGREVLDLGSGAGFPWLGTGRGDAQREIRLGGVAT